jgi:hypothetical protein
VQAKIEARIDDAGYEIGNQREDDAENEDFGAEEEQEEFEMEV